ncbi:hypothetical protein AVEN_69996-1 [Araneus ventricosus]|uniref:Uncharacterized protein n=1 Tax=Araneus ventricosus TaxID=182803 RepID=A0A4Y2KMP4_ARAVE|nr:hypothetical protein AVEN_69996-1 [Araneus ventricosus]
MKNHPNIQEIRPFERTRGDVFHLLSRLASVKSSLAVDLTVVMSLSQTMVSKVIPLAPDHQLLSIALSTLQSDLHGLIDYELLIM